MARKYYYAVAQGREVGIYSDWATCHAHVANYPCACYKKFNTRREAEAFLVASAEERARLGAVFVTDTCAADAATTSSKRDDGDGDPKDSPPIAEPVHAAALPAQ
mmetsp:Transcript_32444/g.82831  ORF Transcript_32444/g.82831 Transcript_32444/m.82831 type:complete len:105 (-) Transcript_32444:586-900(-)